MSEEKNWFRKFSSFTDQNIRGVQYGIYSLAGLGLLIALRSVRPFAKFSLPSDIPSHFVEKKMPFIGKVIRIEPGQSIGMNPIIFVDHQPLIALSQKIKSDGLPLEISSVTVTGNGFLWLQSLLSDKKITFIPIRTTKEKVYSLIFSGGQNIGQHLVKIGFATVSPIDFELEKDNYYIKYYKNLLAAEKYAEKKGLGIWLDNKVSFSKFLLNKFKRVIPFSL